MSFECYLLNLPDLPLQKICEFMNNPFDLLNFGNTCSRLYKITLSESLWWSLAFQWFEGIWIYLDKPTHNLKPREWFLVIMRYYLYPKPITQQVCNFRHGETWERVEYKIFRFLVNIARLSYRRRPKGYPFSSDRWLYDIGLYRRIGPCIKYAPGNLPFSEDVVQNLASIGEASERDLRRRKQPYKDAKYYITYFKTAKNWTTDLFPKVQNETTCPMLFCPFKDFDTVESSGFDGLDRCISIVLEKCLKSSYKQSSLFPNDIIDITRSFQALFLFQFKNALPIVTEKYGNLSLQKAVQIAIEQNLVDLTDFNDKLQHLGLRFKTEDILHNIVHFFNKIKSIDDVVDNICLKFRKLLISEIEKILFPNNETNLVTRLNLTDSDLLGGDNYYQGTSSAAFISNDGVYVIWHTEEKLKY